MAKVTIDNLASEIEKIMESYGDEVSKNMDEIVRKVGQKGAQALRNESKSTFGTNDYPKSWTYKVERNRLYTTVTIYSRTPGLPHLLEHGHAIVSGGRKVGDARAFEHIEPVEKELIEDYEKEVMRKL